MSSPSDAEVIGRSLDELEVHRGRFHQWIREVPQSEWRGRPGED